MKWIITGGAGFIGCHAAARCLARGDEVVLIDNLSRLGAPDNLAWLRERGLTTFHQTDVRDAAAVQRIVAAHGDAHALLHLAAQVAVTWSVRDPRHDFENNALGTLNVLEAVRTGAHRDMALLYSSTNKVYGTLKDLACDERPLRHDLANRSHGVGEDRPLDFHSPYGCSKGAGDQYVRDYARLYGLRTVVLRQSCIYGTRQFGVEDQGWVAWFCIAGVTNRPIVIYGDGKQVRDLLWVEDLLDLYDRVVENIDRVRGEVFNIGGGPDRTLSLLELLEYLQKRLGRRITPRIEAARPGDQTVFVTDGRKARRLLGWQPEVKPADGVDRLLAWIEEAPARFDLT